MIDTVNDRSALSDAARQDQACRCTQVGCHDLSAGELLNAVTNCGIAFNFRTRAHTDKLRNVHKAVFKYRFGDNTGTFCHQVQQGELRLHVGRECRMWRGTHIDCFRAFAVHIQADPVFTDFNISAGFTKLSQHRIQRVRFSVTTDNFATGNRRRHQEGAGFNTVRQNAINTAAQTLNAFDSDTVGALTCHLRAHGVEEVRSIDDLRLTRGVFDNSSPFRQRSSSHDGDGRANADHVHHDMCTFQTTINGRFDVAFFQFNFRA